LVLIARERTQNMSDDPVCELHNDGDDVFVLVDGMKIAKRGRPYTAEALMWIMLEPGWIVRDVERGNAIEVRFEVRGFIRRARQTPGRARSAFRSPGVGYLWASRGLS
jgi:hypothetical protein